MELARELKQAICALFEVVDDADGVQRVITPLHYPDSNDHVVVRVRPRERFMQIDENGEAAFYATMHGGDTDSETVSRWAEDLRGAGLLDFTEDQVIKADVSDLRMVAPAILQVAAASQQLFALATSHKERSTSDFKERVAAVVQEVCTALSLPLEHNVELPIAGGLDADHVIGNAENPLIVIAATSATRLLEAEVIHMQYLFTKQAGFVLAVAESDKIVGVKQFHRANYYTGKTVQFSEFDFGQLLRRQLH